MWFPRPVTGESMPFRVMRPMSLSMWFFVGWFLNACQAEHRAVRQVAPIEAQHIVFA